MRHLKTTPLTDKQLAAVKFLATRGDMPLSEEATNPKAINRSTAWALEEAGFALTYFEHPAVKERVKLVPAIRQLVAMQPLPLAGRPRADPER